MVQRSASVPSALSLEGSVGGSSGGSAGGASGQDGVSGVVACGGRGVPGRHAGWVPKEVLLSQPPPARPPPRNSAVGRDRGRLRPLGGCRSSGNLSRGGRTIGAGAALTGRSPKAGQWHKLTPSGVGITGSGAIGPLDPGAGGFLQDTSDEFLIDFSQTSPAHGGAPLPLGARHQSCGLGPQTVNPEVNPAAVAVTRKSRSSQVRPGAASSLSPRPLLDGSSSPVGGVSVAGLGGVLSGRASSVAGEEQDSSHLRVEMIRLRKQLHKQACELSKTREQLDLAQRELGAARSENDELRLKCSNMERKQRTTGAELLEERCKSDELSKQVKAMSQNLMSIMGQHEAGDGAKEIMGLQKRCFKLVQQNTALTVQSRLLRRQKGWAEAKARVLQDEVSKVYLGTHDQVKSWGELETTTIREFSQREVAQKKDEAQICKLLLPAQYKHKEAVIDFLTHITHTSGSDVLSFLQSNRVFSEGIRNECLNGLGREYYAHWRLIRQLPMVLRATERIVHLREYLDAFEGFSKEVSELLGCALAKLWVADHVRNVLWTCVRVGEEPHTFEVPLPKGRDCDLVGQGLSVAACVEQKVISSVDAGADPRHSQATDMVGNRPAKTAICVPVIHKGKVRVVLQAMNKLQEPGFDGENDARVLRLLGRVSMEVLQVCESNSTQSAFAKRKDSLLQLFNDFVPCHTSVQLIHAVETGLRELFQSKVAALHSVENREAPLESQGTALLQVDAKEKAKEGRRRSTCVQQIKTQGLRGIVGSVVRSMRTHSYSRSQIGRSPFDAEVDLEVTEKGILHTVPLVDTGGVAAVIQFVCPERTRSIVGDDGTFRPDNMQHMRLLNFLMKFVQKHLAILSNTGLSALQMQLQLQESGAHASASVPGVPGADEARDEATRSPFSDSDGSGLEGDSDDDSTSDDDGMLEANKVTMGRPSAATVDSGAA